MASVERYDTENQVWDTVAPIKIARSALSLTVLDGKLYAMGGFDGQFLSVVEIYDPTKDHWEEGTPLPSGRSGHASAVIYQPSCAYMDCVEDQINRSKKSPEDDENKPGPSNKGGSATTKGPSHSNGSANHLHTFSGNRCTHCDNVNTNETEEQESVDHQMQRQKKNLCSKENQSKYEQQCREAIYSLLRMDHEEKIRKQQRENNNNRIEPQLMIPDDNANMDLDISGGEETNDYDSFEMDNPKRLRRKVIVPSTDGSENDENSNSVCSENSNNLNSGSGNSSESYSSIRVASDLRNRLKAKPNEIGQCSLVKLKNKVRQNISDFVTWSSQSVSAPMPKCIPQDSNQNDSHNVSNISNTNVPTDERKCDLLRKYYKCKLKYCNTSK